MTLRQLGYGALIGATALVIAIGSATTADAKHNKKHAAAAPAPTYGWCTLQTRAPVCAARGKQTFTYANACFAHFDGAKGAKAGACKEKKVAKKGGGKKKVAKKASKKKVAKAKTKKT
jgi:hypothetical protein